MEIYLTLLKVLKDIKPDEVLLVVSEDNTVDELFLSKHHENTPILSISDVINFLSLDIPKDADYAIVKIGTYYRVTKRGRIVTKKSIIQHTWNKAG